VTLKESSSAAPSWLDESLVTSLSIAEQLALDEALLDEAEAGRLAAPVVRTWQADRPAVVVGSSSRLDEEINREACQRQRVAVLRRPSGGATVLLGPGCVMWAVVTPHPEVPPIDAIHSAMLAPLAAALTAAAGRPVLREGTSDLAVELADGTRKVSGNALRIRRRAVLYHGTLLNDFPLELVGQLLRHPPREPGYRQQRRHTDFLANLGIGRVAIDAAVRTAFEADRAVPTWPAQQVQDLVATRYGQASWTERL
jgi:lipoate-protein ligase A